MSWKPFSKDNIEKLINTQYTELSFEEKTTFNELKIPLKQAKIKRPKCDPETVWLIAKLNEYFIFFEDVEETFCISKIDENNFIDSDYYDYGFYEFIFTVQELKKHFQKHN